MFATYTETVTEFEKIEDWTKPILCVICAKEHSTKVYSASPTEALAHRRAKHPWVELFLRERNANGNS